MANNCLAMSRFAVKRNAEPAICMSTNNKPRTGPWFRNWDARSRRLTAMGTVVRISDVRRARAQRARDGSVGDRKVRARRYRQRAEELRSISEEVMLKETCLTLLSLAESYDQMASVMERMASDKR